MPSRRSARPRARRRVLFVLAAITPIALLALWIAIQRVAWVGPTLADAGRAILGPDAIARLEDWAYAAQDRWNGLVHRGDAPVAYWAVPPPDPVPSPAPSGSAEAHEHAPPAFHPADVGPVYTSFFAPGDGTWVPMRDARRPDEPPALFKTLLHPDKNRSWSAVSIVALDLAHVEVHLVAGKQEPESVERGSEDFARTGVVPPSDLATLLAAWNGGFKTIHGHHGVMIDGTVFVAPRPDSCTISALASGALTIGTWSRLAPEAASMRWYRQAPACMVEGGKLHPGLAKSDTTYWGSTLDGGTVIRRSAIGLDASRRTLFVGIGDNTTAGAIARAMQHAGASDVAQLDVNWSYPKFLTYAPRGGELVAEPLCKGFDFKDDEYIGKPALRDFFYATRR